MLCPRGVTEMLLQVEKILGWKVPLVVPVPISAAVNFTLPMPGPGSGSAAQAGASGDAQATNMAIVTIAISFVVSADPRPGRTYPIRRPSLDAPRALRQPWPPWSRARQRATLGPKLCVPA